MNTFSTAGVGVATTTAGDATGTPFVSSLRASLGASAAPAAGAPAPASRAGKAAMVSMFDGLDLTLDASGGVVSRAGGSSSAARDLLASKGAEKQAELAQEAAHARKRQQQREEAEKKQKQQPVTALSQALGLFDSELEQRDAFVSRNTRKSKTQTASGRGPRGRKARDGNKAPVRGAASSKGRRQRQDKYKRV